MLLAGPAIHPKTFGQTRFLQVHRYRLLETPGFDRSEDKSAAVRTLGDLPPLLQSAYVRFRRILY